ncbi:hypothetical protein [Anaerorhabdus sp.]|uniref:hypothetical protein n=1 Tax=Anaerorhabdus sp. TaxID=1872524 RepID=UPI002B20CF1F|nr:hypothetical protein [Anaerorhabdus sp.]MEA4874685.1 hypothetical protein [Anaerorhabdus sp.]
MIMTTFGSSTLVTIAEEKELNNAVYVEPRAVECRGTASTRSSFNSNITITVSGTWVYRTDGTWSYNETRSASGAPSTMRYVKEGISRFDSGFNYGVYEYHNGSLVNYYSINVPMACNG